MLEYANNNGESTTHAYNIAEKINVQKELEKIEKETGSELKSLASNINSKHLSVLHGEFTVEPGKGLTHVIKEALLAQENTPASTPQVQHLTI